VLHKNVEHACLCFNRGKDSDQLSAISS